jgi:hypothetical protein
MGRRSQTSSRRHIGPFVRGSNSKTVYLRYAAGALTQRSAQCDDGLEGVGMEQLDRGVFTHCPSRTGSANFDMYSWTRHMSSIIIYDADAWTLVVHISSRPFRLRNGL